MIYTPHLIRPGRAGSPSSSTRLHQPARSAEAMGVSRSAIAADQVAVCPNCHRISDARSPLDRLRSHRDQLWSLRRQTLQLAATIRHDLRELDEELEAARVDRLLAFVPDEFIAGSPPGGSAISLFG